MLAWYICYWWCLYCLQDASDRWRQLWRDKHCGTTIPKSIFSLLNHKCCGTNLQLRSKRKTTWKRSFGCKQYPRATEESWEWRKLPRKRSISGIFLGKQKLFLKNVWKLYKQFPGGETVECRRGGKKEQLESVIQYCAFFGFCPV